MISTRRGFLSHFAIFAAASPWRPGRSSPLPQSSAHDTLQPAATVPSHAQQNSPPLPPDLLDWLHRPRQPIDADDLAWAAEFSRNELHHEMATSNRSGMAQAYKARLREIDLARLLLPRIDQGQPLAFTYHGGTTPGDCRTVLPTLLFTVPDDWCNESSWPGMNPLYLLAHCLKRNAPRIFRLDRLHF